MNNNTKIIHPTGLFWTGLQLWKLLIYFFCTSQRNMSNSDPDVRRLWIDKAKQTTKCGMYMMWPQEVNDFQTTFKFSRESVVTKCTLMEQPWPWAKFILDTLFRIALIELLCSPLQMLFCKESCFQGTYILAPSSLPMPEVYPQKSAFRKVLVFAMYTLP